MRKYFADHYFIRLSNGRFLIIEGAFIYMTLACTILTYGVLEFYNEWLIIPFLLPFLFGVYLFIGPKIKNINVLGWRTQLYLLKDFKMPYEDRKKEARLENRWHETYGQDFEDLKFSKWQKWHPVALVIITLTVVGIWSIG